MANARVRGLLAFGLVGLLAGSLSGCKGPRLISQSDEIQLGREAGDQFEREHGRDNDPALNTLITTIGSRVAAVAQPPDYSYDVRILASKEVNAVAFPGGRIYVYRGLIDEFERNPDKLAWIIGHETTHVARRHAARRIERQMGYEAVIALILKQGDVAKLAGVAANLVLLDYGRDNEFEADQMGMRFSHAAGYDPTASVAVLRHFQELQSEEPSNFEIMFMTHPGNDDRINNAKQHLEAQGWSGQYYQPGAEG